MKQILKLFFLFFLLASAPYANAKQRLRTINTPNKIIQIIGGKSLENYWVVDEHKTILHFQDGQWISYPFSDLFSNTEIRKFHPIYVEDDRLIILLTDTDWKTYISEIDQAKIIRYSYVAPFPLHRVTKVSNTLYSSGDFGMLIKLENNEWKRIATPIQSHINAVEPDPNGILWLRTNGEGIYSWDGVEFTSYNNHEEIKKSTLTDIRSFENGLYIRTINGKVYRLSDQNLERINVDESPFPIEAPLISNGHYKIASKDGKIFSFPIAYKIKSYQELEDGQFLLLSQNLGLLYNQEYSGNFFLNYASILGIEGPEFTFSGVDFTYSDYQNKLYNNLRSGIIFSDFNKDDFLDILLFNISDFRRPFLYLNNTQNYFTNFTDPIGLNQLSFNGFYSYSFDLNGDGKPEIISSNYKNGTYEVNIYTKTAGRYQLSFSFQIPKKYANRPPQQISISDIDSDGDLDLVLVFGYSQAGMGNILYLINNGYADFKPIENIQANLFEGWNTKTIHVDFNNDGLDDIYIVRNWRSNVINFKTKENAWRQSELNTDTLQHQQRKGDATVFDFDNDGDLDIFSLGEDPFIRVLENDGSGNFVNITREIGLADLNTGKKGGTINSGDFDNNGFTDLFLNVSSEGINTNYIFLNDSARIFVDQSEELGIKGSNLEFAAIGDIDNDGDLDLYGFKKGHNVLWRNNLDSTNFLRIKLTGVKSNRQGLGAKIWIYENGHLNDSNYLIGYRQIGSQLTGLNFQNESVAHFGLSSQKKYDILIKFKAGKTKILYAISPGLTLQITEIEDPFSWWYTWDNHAYILIMNREFRSYLFTILIGLLLISLTIYIGRKRFNWDIPLANIILSINIILFVILLSALSSSKPFIKYYIPLGVIFFGSIGPIGFFYWIKSSLNLKTLAQKKQELFQSLLNFTHGAWALSNLNSLQLYFENLSVQDMANEEYYIPFLERKKTFIDLTIPILNQIISLNKSLQYNQLITQDLENSKYQILQTLNQDFSRINFVNTDKISSAIIELRDSLSKLKLIVFASYSCNPEKLTQNLRNELKSILSKEDINLNIISFLSKEDNILMDSQELTSILDNCVQNSIKALKYTKEKQLTIKLLKNDPRIFIEIIDNGCGIPDDKFNVIFENGYSTNNSTGYGLYYCKETLSKFGGRITLKESDPNKKTKFVIELQNGYKNEN